MIKKIFLNEIDNISLHSLIGETAPIAFIGSGISLWAPSDLPSGIQFSKSVFSFLFSENSGKSHDPNSHILDKYLKNLPFEIINERCPDPQGIENLLRSIYDSYKPNPLHELFSNLLFEGKIQSIITPNYDCCFDVAIAKVFDENKEENREKVIRVVNETDALIDNGVHASFYFKIHGSTDDKSGKSLVFRLNQEGVLPPWKRSLFRTIIKGNTLLIVGYSGKDFDICPEIALAKPKQIIWNLFEEKELIDSINLQNLSEENDVYIIIGDMRVLLSRLYKPLTAIYRTSEINLEQILKEKFDVDCKNLWRIRILNSINNNKSALNETSKEIIKPHKPTTLISYLSEHAGALASSGRYRDAAKTHDKAATIAHENSVPINLYLTQLLLACDAWRCYGSILQTYLRFQKADAIIRNNQNLPANLLADLDRNKILIFRHIYDFFRKIRLRFLEKKIQQVVAEIFPRAVKYYRENGEWYQLQQMGLWRERFHLNQDVSLYEREYATPISNAGYQQLNFLMGSMMAFRHNLDDQNRTLTTDEIEKARGFISDANAFGITPEIWKLSLLIMLKTPKESFSFFDFKEFFVAFWKCQYSLLFRIWRLVLGD
jgi:hypothetical protein